MTAADIATPSRAGLQKSAFYLWTAVAMAVVAVAGFAPTFGIPLAEGVPERFPLFAIHGALCYGWIGLVIYQAWLARSGHVARHRDLGLAGVSLATALVLFGTMTSVSSVRRTMAAGHIGANEAFLIVPMGELICFTGFVIAALVNVRRSEWHKRFMIAATGAILPAPVARLFIVFVLMGGHLPPWNGTVGLAGLPAAPPPLVSEGLMPDLIATEVFILAGMVHDWRRRGGVHPAWWWAGGLNLAFQLLKAPFSDTALWHVMARGLIQVF